MLLVSEYSVQNVLHFPDEAQKDHHPFSSLIPPDFLQMSYDNDHYDYDEEDAGDPGGHRLQDSSLFVIWRVSG